MDDRVGQLEETDTLDQFDMPTIFDPDLVEAIGKSKARNLEPLAFVYPPQLQGEETTARARAIGIVDAPRHDRPKATLV